jgi:AcrR family transcriptional regulator
MNERSRKELPSPSRLEKRKGGVSPEAIARFVQAYLRSLPEGRQRELSSVLQGFRIWIQEVSEADPPSHADLLEAVTLLAQWEGLKVGELLVEITGELKEDRRDSPLKHGKRSRILESAYRVFSEKGFFQATVDEIAERAGVGKGTVYRHFESKENLFRAVVDEELRVIVGRIQEAFLEAEDVLQAIRRAVREYLEYFEEHKEFYRILVFEQESFGSEFRARYINEILKRIPMIRDQVLEAASRGRLKPLDDFYTVFYGLVGFTDGVILKWFQKGCQGSLTNELDTIIEVLFYGFVRNGAGRTLSEEKERGGDPSAILSFPERSFNPDHP